jgi:c-di-GMP-binding flagellar brake protein YcgR
MENTMEHPATGAATPSAQYAGKTEKIADPVRIGGLLARLKNERALLSVSVSASSELYNSAVLEVHPDRGYFVIDEMSPAEGNRHLQKVSRLRLRARLKGVEVSFEALLESTGKQDGVIYYRLVFPAFVYYHQQRAHYRARVGHAKSIPVQIVRANGKEVTGELNDISIGGIGVRFPSGLPADIARGEEIQRCRIRLSSGEEIACRIEVRFISVGVSGGANRMMGARFLELSPIQQATIARFVASLDREFARKSHQVRD